MAKGLSIVGASRANGPREENDFYPTPSCATEALLKKETFEGHIFECACGDGAMSKVIKEWGYDVDSADIIDRGFGRVGDFLAYDCLSYPNIITNPPFKYALEFVEKAKEVSTGKIAFLLRTVFLESQRRQPMFLDKVFPLKVVYQFSTRITIYKNGEKMKNSGVTPYAWFVWDKAHSGKAHIDWI